MRDGTWWWGRAAVVVTILAAVPLVYHVGYQSYHQDALHEASPAASSVEDLITNPPATLPAGPPPEWKVVAKRQVKWEHRITNGGRETYAIVELTSRDGATCKYEEHRVGFAGVVEVGEMVECGWWEGARGVPK